MLLLLPIWLVLFTMLVGWGLLVLWILERASGGAIRGALATFQTMWLGYAGLVAFLVLVSLVLPIARFVLVVSFAPAIAGFALQRHTVLRRLRTWRDHPRTCIAITCVTLVAASCVAYAACDQVIWYDTDLYHLQVVKWNASYAAVPGLANLHLRFGYDNSIHVFGALVDAFWQGVGVHAMNGFLMAAVLGHWFAEIFGARTPRGRLRQAYCLLTLPFLLAKVWTIEIASFSSDLPLAILSFVLVLELLSLPRASRSRLMLPLALIVSVAAVATTTKLGGLALFGVAGICALWLVGRGVGRRPWLALFGLPAVMMAAWVVRNVIVSGWLLFPVFGRLPVAWAVPAAAGADHLRWIESWARMPQQAPAQVLDHGFLHWFVPWFDGFRGSHEMILLAASAALLAFRIVHGPAGTARRAGEWAAFAACALGIVQWFIGAPDLRFGAFLFWALPAVLFAPVIAGAMRDATIRGFAIVFAIAFCSWSGGLTPRLDDVVPRLLHRPKPPTKPPVSWRETGPATEVSFPTSGDDRCGDAELSCTPNPGTQTRRDPGSIGAGFYAAPPL